MTREQQAAVAAETIVQSTTIRSRLFRELDELERSLRGMREVVETLPQDDAKAVPRTSERNREWTVRQLWNG